MPSCIHLSHLYREMKNYIYRNKYNSIADALVIVSFHKLYSIHIKFVIFEQIKIKINKTIPK